MILVVTNREQNERTGREEIIVSHGVDIDDNDKIVVLPCDTPAALGAVFNAQYGEYVLN